VDLRLVEQFKQGGLAKREACSSLLQQIHLGLRAVTVNTTDYESLQVIQAARRLYEPPGKSLSLAQKMELTRMFADAYESARSEPMVKLIAEKVLRYNEQLRLFGIRDHQVMETKFTGFRELRLFLERILLLLASLVLSVPGILVHLPVAVVASWISKRKAEGNLLTTFYKSNYIKQFL
jgi:glycerol-3-phosphate O-acyltransferase/dihydroxyacetone phosphate acyltransferase